MLLDFGAPVDLRSVRNGLLVDIAGRQRMLIQRMCKEALIIALGVTWQGSAVWFWHVLTLWGFGVATTHHDFRRRVSWRSWYQRREQHWHQWHLCLKRHRRDSCSASRQSEFPNCESWKISEDWEVWPWVESLKPTHVLRDLVVSQIFMEVATLWKIVGSLLESWLLTSVMCFNIWRNRCGQDHFQENRCRPFTVVLQHGVERSSTTWFDNGVFSLTVMVTMPTFQSNTSSGWAVVGSHCPFPVDVQGSMCTMHQMGEVSFYFRQVRPYIRKITNAPTIQESSSVAARVASDLASNWAPHDMFYGYLRLAFGVGIWKTYGFHWFPRFNLSHLSHALALHALSIFSFWCIWHLVLGFFLKDLQWLEHVSRYQVWKFVTSIPKQLFYYSLLISTLSISMYIYICIIIYIII